MAEIFSHYAIGTTLANMVNIQAIVDQPAHAKGDNRIPLLGPIGRRAADNSLTRVGSINKPLQVWAMLQTSMRTLINDTFGGYNVASKQLYVSAIGEDGYYSAFSVVLDRPYEGENYTVSDATWLKGISIPGYGWLLQSVTKVTTATLTASERLVYGNTAGGGFTMTLPAASALQANTVLSIQKSAAANTLTIARAGADLINLSASSLTRAANNARVDLVSDGVSAWVTI